VPWDVPGEPLGLGQVVLLVRCALGIEAAVSNADAVHVDLGAVENGRGLTLLRFAGDLGYRHGLRSFRSSHASTALLRNIVVRPTTTNGMVLLATQFRIVLGAFPKARASSSTVNRPKLSKSTPPSGGTG